MGTYRQKKLLGLDVLNLVGVSHAVKYSRLLLCWLLLCMTEKIIIIFLKEEIQTQFILRSLTEDIEWNSRLLIHSEHWVRFLHVRHIPTHFHLLSATRLLWESHTNQEGNHLATQHFLHSLWDVNWVKIVHVSKMECWRAYGLRGREGQKADRGGSG